MSFFRGIEVGHVFKLGTKYSKALGANFLDPDGKSHPMVMGCYGIGVSRIVAAAIEQNNDDWGILWPLPMAPFEVIVTPTNVSEDKPRQAAESIYKDLMEAGISTLLDDRDLRAGFKFKDADLIGIPVRVTVGEKSLAKDQVELKLRHEKNAKEVPLKSILKEVQSCLVDLKSGKK